MVTVDWHLSHVIDAMDSSIYVMDTVDSSASIL